MEAPKALATYYEQEKVALSVTLAELSRQRSGVVNFEPVETSARFVEPATGIEPATCGLRRPDEENLTDAESPLQSSESDDTSKG